MGFVFSFAVVPVYERLITYTKQAGYQDNMATMSAIGSLFWSAYAAGYVSFLIDLQSQWSYFTLIFHA